MAVSRRAFIAGTGAAVVVGPGAAVAATKPVGLSPEARAAIEVIGTIEQDALNLTGFGWLTHVADLNDADLFTDPATTDASTARLRWHAEVTVMQRNLLPNLFSATGKGDLRIFFDSDGGAQGDQPESFATGRLVARYSGRYQNVLTVIAPDQAVVEITGELKQREAKSFQIGGGKRQLGRVGLLQRLSASGPGSRSEPTVPRATFQVAGGIVVPD
jgi:hypothetical protein